MRGLDRRREGNREDSREDNDEERRRKKKNRFRKYTRSKAKFKTFTPVLIRHEKIE